MALSHLPGLPMIAGAAMGIGAMTCAMLGLPLTSVLLATVFLGSDGVAVMPLVIVAVVVTYVGHARSRPGPEPHPVPSLGSRPLLPSSRPLRRPERVELLVERRGPACPRLGRRVRLAVLSGSSAAVRD